MARESQYLNAYLNTNRKRGVGNGLTIGSFLAYTLSGRAREYSGKYAHALENSLKRAGAIEGKSKLGGIAYYPADTE